MAVIWKTAAKGIRYYEHESRKHGVRRDRYFALRYRHEGKTITEALGWASQGWTLEKATIHLAKLKEAHRTGEGAQTLSEQRAVAKARRDAEAAAKAEADRANTTFADQWKLYFPETQAKKVAASSQREDALARHHILPVLGKRRLQDVGELHLQKLVSAMQKHGAAPRSIEYALAVVRQVFNHARDHGVFAGTNPVQVKRFIGRHKSLKVENKRERYLTAQEAAALLDALKERSQVAYELALASLHTGARSGELFALRWKDISFDHGTIHLVDTKSSDRVVYMTPLLAKMLAGKKRGSPGELVWPSENGKVRHRAPRQFRETVRALGFNDDIEDRRQRLCFHSLRHSCASFLIKAGCSIYAAKEQLGHKNVATTQRYAHLSPEALARNAAAIAEACTVLDQEQTAPARVLPLRRAGS